MSKGARYVKIVEWSEVDQCFVGSCPGLFFGGCHGSDEKRVFEELCDIVEETIKLYHAQGKPLPPCTSPAARTLPIACNLPLSQIGGSPVAYLAAREAQENSPPIHGGAGRRVPT
jgi:hypothetical protein